MEKALALMHEMCPGKRFTMERDARSATWAFFCGSFYVPLSVDTTIVTGAAEIAAAVVRAFDEVG